MYAIVKTGGKQYRVEQGQSLVVERLPASSEGDSVELAPLLYVDGDSIVDGPEGLSKVTVSARIVGHERGAKLRVVKFKPKRGYKRRTGHRQDLTRIEVTQIKLAGGRSRGAARAEGEDEAAAPKPVAAAPKEPKAEKPAGARGGAAAKGSAPKDSEAAAPKGGAAPKGEAAAEKPARKPRAPAKPRAAKPKADPTPPKEADDGS